MLKSEQTYCTQAISLRRLQASAHSSKGWKGRTSNGKQIAFSVPPGIYNHRKRKMQELIQIQPTVLLGEQIPEIHPRRIV